ncbi:C-type lectin galactose-binding isoform-like [Clavelina lepadiformis]|uniref:C-type lectin galactose-binding isoform-like n=1 Tax=Clavelina lepadiformis TaxID=159417 RepID=UPI0040417601
MIYTLLCLALFATSIDGSFNCCSGYAQLRRELKESLTSDWFVPFNGYKYKVTSGTHSWTDARHECRKMGADLATAGARSPETLK